jgi:hypothetical protein
MTIAPLMMRFRMNDEDIAIVPPAVMLPLESRTMLFVALVGWTRLMVFTVLMRHL